MKVEKIQIKYLENYSPYGNISCHFKKRRNIHVFSIEYKYSARKYIRINYIRVNVQFHADGVAQDHSRSSHGDYKYGSKVSLRFVQPQMCYVFADRQTDRQTGIRMREMCGKKAFCAAPGRPIAVPHFYRKKISSALFFL